MIPSLPAAEHFPGRNIFKLLRSRKGNTPVITRGTMHAVMLLQLAMRLLAQKEVCTLCRGGIPSLWGPVCFKPGGAAILSSYQG